MRQEIHLSLSPESASDLTRIQSAVARQLDVPHTDITGVEVLRRSIDARKGKVRIQLKIQAFLGEPVASTPLPERDYPNVERAPEVIVVGAGPAGLFAALALIKAGLRPIVLERGKDVRSRRRDLAAINREHLVDPDSNYCFGEGGAGTYSDGKLYTRSTKRGDVRSVLDTLVAFGASPDIRVDAHPHIGTNKLPQIIVAMREQIIASGGAVEFNQRVTEFVVKDGAVTGVKTATGDHFTGKAVLLATGHSARDIFELLNRQKIAIEAKPFAIGVRIEHPQGLIDSIQYHRPDRGEYLPPASYSLVHQVRDRGVYSFCMCPGGIIAPCATAPGEIVTNGWSPSKRNNPYANSGVVVSVTEQDLAAAGFHGRLAGLRLQQQVEQRACVVAGNSQAAPAQRLTDFVSGRPSSSLPDNSYVPGTVSVRLTEVLPKFISKRLQAGFKAFGQKMRGYFTEEAVLVAPESRTSSPVRIPRDPETLEHPQIAGLYPCGEGGGYAGGIVSAAIDGEKCAMAIARKVTRTE